MKRTATDNRTGNAGTFNRGGGVCGSFTLATAVMVLLACLVLAGCGGGDYSSSGTSTTSVVEKPTVTASDAAATLDWTPATTVDSYNVYWSTTAGVTPQTGTKEANVSRPFTMSGLANGTTYYFVITAVSKGREGAPSAELVVTPKQPPPGTPPKVSALAGDTFIVIQWEQVPGATSYNLYWGLKPGTTPIAGERFLGVTSPYLHKIPLEAVPGMGQGGGSGSHGSGESTATTVAAAAVMEPVSSAGGGSGCSGSGGSGGKGGKGGMGGKTTPTMFYYAVTAVGPGGESKISAEVGAAPVNPGGKKGGEEASAYGSNLSVPLIFAEGYGMGGLPVTDSTGAKLYANTGLRTPAGTPPAPFWSTDFAELYLTNGVTYYLQKSSSSWQAEWRSGIGTPQAVSVDWSDNITGHVWSAKSVIHIEHVLSQAPVDESGAPTDLMTAYTMQHLFGDRYAERFGADGTTYQTNFRTVFTPNARLTIEKLTGKGGTRDPVFNGGMPVIDKAVYEGFGADGPGWYRPEVNGSGKLVYGYNFMLKQLAGEAIQKTGWWRITFSIDPVATYTITDGTTSTTYSVPANTMLVAIDPTDTGSDKKFVPTISGNSTVLEIEVKESPSGGGSSGGTSHGGSSGGGSTGGTSHTGSSGSGGCGV